MPGFEAEDLGRGASVFKAAGGDDDGGRRVRRALTLGEPDLGRHVEPGPVGTSS